MGTLTEKLQYTKSSVEDIADAITEKNIAIPSDVKLGEYGDLIRLISSDVVFEIYAEQYLGTDYQTVSIEDKGDYAIFAGSNRADSASSAKVCFGIYDIAQKILYCLADYSTTSIQVYKTGSYYFQADNSYIALTLNIEQATITGKRNGNSVIFCRKT